MFQVDAEYELLFDGIVYEYTNSKWNFERGNCRNNTLFEFRRYNNIEYEKEQMELVREGKAFLLRKGSKVRVKKLFLEHTVTSSAIYVTFEVLSGERQGTLAELDSSWGACDGEVDTDKKENRIFDGINFHYPDPKYFQKVNK